MPGSKRGVIYALSNLLHMSVCIRKLHEACTVRKNTWDSGLCFQTLYLFCTNTDALGYMYASVFLDSGSHKYFPYVRSSLFVEHNIRLWSQTLWKFVLKILIFFSSWVFFSPSFDFGNKNLISHGKKWDCLVWFFLLFFVFLNSSMGAS